MRGAWGLLFLVCSAGLAAAETPSALTAAAGRYAAELVRCDNSEWESVVRTTAGILYDHIGSEKALAATEGILAQVTSAKGSCNRQALASARRTYERALKALRPRRGRGA